MICGSLASVARAKPQPPGGARFRGTHRPPFVRGVLLDTSELLATHLCFSPLSGSVSLIRLRWCPPRWKSHNDTCCRTPTVSRSSSCSLLPSHQEYPRDSSVTDNAAFPAPLTSPPLRQNSRPRKSQPSSARSTVIDETMVMFDWQECDVVVCDNKLVAHGRQLYQPPRSILAALATTRG